MNTLAQDSKLQTALYLAQTAHLDSVPGPTEADGILAVVAGAETTETSRRGLEGNLAADVHGVHKSFWRQQKELLEQEMEAVGEIRNFVRR